MHIGAHYQDSSLRQILEQELGISPYYSGKIDRLQTEAITDNRA